MSTPEEPAPLPASKRESLEARIHDLETDEYPLFDDASRRNYRLAEGSSWTAILSGIVVSALSTLRESQLFDAPFLGPIVILLPVLGSIAASLQNRFLERKNLFERGRQRMQSTLRRAKRRFAAACEDNGDFAQIEQDLMAEVEEIEAARLVGYLTLAHGDSEAPA